MSKEPTLRKLLDRKGLLVAPGVYDALTAKVAQYTGFQALYMTGYGTSASYGYPDIGLLTMTEMLENLRRVCAAVDIPVIADADTRKLGDVVENMHLALCDDWRNRRQENLSR